MVKPGAAVVGAGITMDGRRIVPDVDEACAEVAGWITPRLGGVGPTTRAMLLRNTVEAAERRAGIGEHTVSRRTEPNACTAVHGVRDAGRADSGRCPQLRARRIPARGARRAAGCGRSRSCIVVLLGRGARRHRRPPAESRLRLGSERRLVREDADRAARRADRPAHPPAHADAPGRARPASTCRRRAPAHGAALLAAVVATHLPLVPEEQRELLPRLLDQARDGLAIPRIALRHRLQHDMHGLDRSRHRVLGEDGRLVIEIDRHASATPQVLGAVMAAARPARRPGAASLLDAIRRVVDGRWGGLADDVEVAHVVGPCVRAAAARGDAAVAAGRAARGGGVARRRCRSSGGRWKCSDCAPGWTWSATT